MQTKTLERRRLHCVVIQRRVYGNIDLRKSEPVNALVVSKEGLQPLKSALLSGDAPLLEQLRARADREPHETILTPERLKDIVRPLLSP